MLQNHAHSIRLAALGAGLGVLVAVGLALAGRGGAEPLPVYWDAPAFGLVDQHGDSLRTADLRGTVWVAGFVFTHCPDVCPLITARMAELRDELARERLLGSRVRLVSITVDPARDSPEVLRAYASAYGSPPPGQWAFLTGSPPERIRAMIQEGFRLTAMVMAGGAAEHEDHAHAGAEAIAHSPRLVLVDADGRVRGTYEATEEGVLGRVSSDVARLLQ